MNCLSFVYFHRDYENDFPKIEKGSSAAFDQSVRIVQMALPFISLYKPFSHPLSIGLGGARVFTTFSELVSSIKANDRCLIGKSLLKVAITTTAVAYSILEHPISTFVTTTQDIAVNLGQLVNALEKKQYKRAAEVCLHLLNNFLYLASFYSISLELSIASIGCQIVIGLYNGVTEWQKGNHLESCTSILMAAIRGKQMQDLVHLLNYRFQVENSLAEIQYYDGFEELYPGYDPSKTYDLSGEGLVDLSDREIGYINGIDNSFQDAYDTARYISVLSGGCNVHGVYNATHGKMADLEESKMSLNYIATNPVRQLHEMWNTFFEKSSADSKYLMICHSQGAIHVRNALLGYPPELRERISVVAIAPGGYIPSESCGSVVHYRVNALRDFIPYFDWSGGKRAQNTTIDLEPNSEAALFDHSFFSPTYFKELLSQIDAFKNQPLIDCL